MKIKPGDELPQSDFFYLDEKNDVKKISTSDLFKAQKIILLGMPGAFTKTCSAVHLPGYVINYELALKKGPKPSEEVLIDGAGIHSLLKRPFPMRKSIF